MSATEKTRRESWDKTQAILGPRQKEVLDLVKEASGSAGLYAGITAWEIAIALKRDVYVVRPRLTELKALGVIVAQGTKFHPGTDRNETSWVLNAIFDNKGQGRLL